MKLRPVGAELFHADGLLDGQTEMNETDSRFFFCNAANRSKILKLLRLKCIVSTLAVN